MEFLNTEVWGFKHAIRSMRNPMNSWDRSDSNYCTFLNIENCTSCVLYEKCDFLAEDYGCILGANDLGLAQKLVLAGNEHAKFMRMIHVSVDVNMPRYWWSEEDTYHFNTKSSCSTMHKLLNNKEPITKDLFVYCKEDEDIVDMVVNRLENLRLKFKHSKDYEEQTRLLVRAKRLLMEGFLQIRTLDTTYAELRNEYFQRRNHRLKEEWIDTFCKWIESLPYAKELIMYEGGEKK